MVKKFLKLFNKEFSGLHEAAFLLGVFALLSQSLALVRDRMFAHHFGAGIELDIYYASFRIPDIIFISVASFVAITVIMPFLIEQLNIKKCHAQKFINNVFTIFFVVVTFVSVLTFFLIPTIVELLFSGFSPSMQDEVITLSRLLLLSPVLLGISNIFASITHTFKKFFVYAISPLLYNIGIIIGLIFLYPSFGVIGIGYGVIFGAFMHLAIQIPVIVKHSFLPRFAFDIEWREIKKVLTLALPRTIGLSINQIVLLVLISIASFMSVGSITVFQLAFNLQSVPLTIIGVSYSVAAFPTLARLITQKKYTEYVAQILTALRHIIFWSMPILALFIVLRAQIVRVILGSGEFSWSDTRLTAAALALFAVSVVAQSVVVLLVRAYYAAGKTRIPVLVGVLSAIFILVSTYFLNILFDINLVFRYFIEFLLRVNDVSGTNILMLPLAYSVGLIINAFVLWRIFKKDFNIKHTKQLQQTFRQSLYSSVIVGFVSYILLSVFSFFEKQDTFYGIFMQGFLSGVGGVLVGILLLKLLKNKEIDEIWGVIHRKFLSGRRKRKKFDKIS